MAGPKKLSTFNRLSGTRVFTTTATGIGTMVIHSNSSRAGVGSTAVTGTNETFFLAGKRNLKDTVPGRFVLASRGGCGSPSGRSGGGGGGGGVYVCGCFDDWPSHGWCINLCGQCSCTKTCLCASPALHLSLCSGCNGCASCPQPGPHIAAGGGGGSGAPATCSNSNFTPLMTNLCFKGSGCDGGGGQVHYNPQPRPGGGGGGGGCGQMRISGCHRLGNSNPYYCALGHGRGGIGRPGSGFGGDPRGFPGNPAPGTPDGGMFYLETPGRASNQVNNTVDDQ